MAEVIGAIMSGVLAVACLVISVMQFKEKGFLFNNAYIGASKQQREAMDKKPHYRQSGIVFALCAAIFFCVALECILLTDWLWFIIDALAVAVLIYVIVSSMKK